MGKKEEDKDISINLPNFGKIARSINPKNLTFLLLILIPLVITITVRLQPIELKATEDWARNSLYTNIRNQISSSVDASYPTMPDLNKQELVDSQFKDTLKTKKTEIEQQIRQVSDYYKSVFQYQENGKTYTYLGDLDSYYYLRQARNLLEKGTVCDKIENGKCLDTFMLAPIGIQMERTLHPYAIVFLYKILHFFSSSINLMYASFYLPTVVAILVSLLAFFVARRIAGDIGGFFAAVFISTSQIFLTRTLGSDTDVWNIFFPILLLFLFIQTVEAKKLLSKLACAGLVGLAFGIYSFAWVAWWFTFDLVLLTYLLYLVYLVVQNIVQHKTDYMKILKDKTIQHETLTVIVIIISSGVFVSLITSFSSFIGSPLQPFSLTSSIDVAAHMDLWPNVYTTVAELNNSSLGEAVATVGGRLIFFLMYLGIILSLFPREVRNRELLLLVISSIIYYLLLQDPALALGIMLYLALLSTPFILGIILVFKDQKVEIKYSLLLLLWVSASLYASLKGVRFVLLLIPIAGVSFGVAVDKLHRIARGLVVTNLKLNNSFRMITGIVLFLIFCTLLITPVKDAYQTGRRFLPSISLTWADSLTYIRDNSPKDAIITSWWDFGHWFKYFAERRVTFDGATQNIPQAHWVGKALLSEDGQVSVGIIRMLNCAGNKAFETLRSLNNDSLKSIEILNKIIPSDKEKARQILAQYLNDPAQIDQILSETHCQPSGDYFITSEDMVSKSGVWAHFGAWDFNKAYIYTNLRSIPRKEALSKIQGLGYSPEEATNLYNSLISLRSEAEANNWISPWPGYVTTSFSPCQKQQNQLICSYNMVLTQDQNNIIVLKQSIIDLKNKTSSYITLSYLDRNTGKELQTVRSVPQAFAITEENDLVRYSPSSGASPLGFDVLVDTKNLRSLLVDPLLTKSLFTKLYYLDGRYAESFSKFSDKEDNIIGHHVIVWKVSFG
jgi:asparagine N-glycosylation enzyme membrane subunit Stt3